jgi:hypothetical protein
MAAVPPLDLQAIDLRNLSHLRGRVSLLRHHRVAPSITQTDETKKQLRGDIYASRENRTKSLAECEILSGRGSRLSSIPHASLALACDSPLGSAKSKCRILEVDGVRAQVEGLD